MIHTAPPHCIKSFVRREGRLTRGQQKALETEWADRVLSAEQGMLNWGAIFNRQAPIVLEIGFGMGQSLWQMAKASPEKDFIGIDIYKPGLGALFAHLKEHAVPNVRVFYGDAATILPSCIPDASLNAIHIFFPDPWPKKRHHKRRLIQPLFVALLKQKLAADGCIYLATDWEDYAIHMMQTLSAASGLTNTAGSSAFALSTDHRFLTKYEERGRRLGHGVWDLVFTKIGMPPA